MASPGFSPPVLIKNASVTQSSSGIAESCSASQSRVTASGFTDSSIGAQSQDFRMRKIEDALDKLMKKLDDQREQHADEGLGTDEEDNTTIHPNDSASLVRPLKTKTELTTFTALKSGFVRGSDHDSIVGGYEIDVDDHLDQLKAIQNIQTVHGLPKIFVDNRLNFLVHLHNPLQEFLTVRGKYPDPNSLESLTRFVDQRKGTMRSPHDELLYQVLRSTIDTRRMRVRANPFNLPIIEIGMELNDQLIYMCLNELYHEFRTSWFHSMKNVQPPTFAHEYESIKLSRRSVNTSFDRKIVEPVTLSSSKKHFSDNYKKKRGSGGSVMGSILSGR